MIIVINLTFIDSGITIRYYMCSGFGLRDRQIQITFNGLFNKSITPITRSTKRKEGIIPNENALRPEFYIVSAL